MQQGTITDFTVCYEVIRKFITMRPNDRFDIYKCFFLKDSNADLQCFLTFKLKRKVFTVF